MRSTTLLLSIVLVLLLLMSGSAFADTESQVCVAADGSSSPCQAPAAPPARTPFRHPVVVVSHGPGPMWLLEGGFAGQSKHSKAAQNVRGIFSKIYGSPSESDSAPSPLPKRILFVTAHWESSTTGAFEISNSRAPDMIYDYYGFPSEAYDVVYGAKGDPDFAARVQSVLAQSEIKAALVDRGFDHGVFVPMSLIRPQADIPVVSVSINDRLDAKAHFELGRALQPLRDEDTLIICSGQATHNLNAGFSTSAPAPSWATEFVKWLDATFADKSNLSYNERQAAVEQWQRIPSAKRAHPTPDHFTPFVVAMGAGMEIERPAATKLFGGWAIGHMSFATYAWGVVKS